MKDVNKQYDFAGWVTKNDIKCLDGVTIKHDAFKENDGEKVPLVWNHDYNSPNNILGHVILQNLENGVYGYGYFNDTKEGQDAKELVKHGDISSMSIGARKIKRSGTNVVHGRIYEVSLVLSGANPGAMIESVMQHSESGGEEETAIVFTGNLIHSYDDVLEHKVDDKKEEGDDETEKTIEEIIDGMTDEQKDAVYALIGIAAEAVVKEEDDIDDNEDDDQTKKDDDKGDVEEMKQNVFNGNGQNASNGEVIKHSYNEMISLALSNKVSSLKDVFAENKEELLKHGINSIEMLFPDSFNAVNGNVPILYRDTNTAALEILNSITKSPFSRVKTVVADLTEEEARAKGYVKGNMKAEEYFSLVKRQTTPTTIYKKQKLDRDDMLDITDFDVVAFMNVEMQAMLKEEIARAVLVGDGRLFSSEEKINEQNVRPIVTDHEFFTIHKAFATVDLFIETVIKAMAEYRGSGLPSMYIDPTLLADIKLLKDQQGRFLFGDIPSNEAIANRLGLKEIVPTTFMTGKGAVIVNLKDYVLGSTKGGQVTSFENFDIDFNQHKYLIETRLAGALTVPKSAIHLIEGSTPTTGADNTAGGVTFGTRQADKTTPTP